MDTQTQDHKQALIRIAELEAELQQLKAREQVGLPIRAVKLFDELQKQADRLRLINEVSQQLTTILNVGDLFGVLAQIIYERLHYLVVAIFEIES